MDKINVGICGTLQTICVKSIPENEITASNAEKELPDFFFKIFLTRRSWIYVQNQNFNLIAPRANCYLLIRFLSSLSFKERNLRPSCVSDESAVGFRGKDSGNGGKDDSLSIHDFP
ncbi:hypothetical protein RIR_jg26122.t1 [Rhizophagus irregularis DAOM 181602=DAOM 197198]|nr:hypothetical protein RIR_jg26122.t1 [Rhizophagus irregularis DAOM 181602=DAOM 197198]